MSGYRIKPWEDLTISDDYMFKLIMSRKRICTKGRLGEIDNSIRAFLQYVDGVMSTDRFVQEIDEEIQKVKRIEGEAVSYMTYEMKIKEERKEERKETRMEDIRRLISKLKISAEQAMDLLEIPQADRQLYKSAL